MKRYPKIEFIEIQWIIDVKFRFDWVRCKTWILVLIELNKLE